MAKEYGNETADVFLPPPPSRPPRLLSDEQIVQLAKQGHLPLRLSPRLESLYTQLDAASNDFFASPLEIKQSYFPSNDLNELGFVSIPDEKDYITFRSRTSQNQQSQLEQLTAQVWAETFLLFKRILSDLSYGLNIGFDVWDDVIDGTYPMPLTLKDATPTFLRIFRYAANKGIAERHTDMGLLTLCVCQGKGLQVLDRSTGSNETWTEYNEPTLLVGQTLSLLSGGIVKSGVHRVVSNSGGRGSIVFALRPNIKHEIDLSLFPGEKNQMQGKVQLGDLWKSIWSRSFNVNAPKQVQEVQKQQLEHNSKTTVGYKERSLDEKDITNTRAAFEL